MSLRNTSSREIAKRLSRFFGLSVAAHAALLLVLAAAGQLRGCAVPDLRSERPADGVEAEPIDVTMIEATPLNPFARPLTAEEEAAKIAAEEERRRQAEDEDASGQTVQIDRPQTEVRPDDAELNAEYDSKTDRQTKAPDLGLPGSRRIVIPGDGKRDVPEPPREAAPTKPGDAKKGAGALAMRGSSEGAGGDDKPLASGDPRGWKPAEGGELPLEGSELPGGKADEPGKGADGDAGKGGNGDGVDLAKLRPTEETLAKVISEGSSDYLPDIDEGAETVLNTKRFKFAGFMNRVQRAVEQTWDPVTEYNLRDPTGQKYGIKDRYTVVKVSLKPDGRIRDLILEKSCGVDFLDEEALDALRLAQPFPNPPEGMINDESNLITFRFGFMFQIGERSSLRIYRYSN